MEKQARVTLRRIEREVEETLDRLAHLLFESRRVEGRLGLRDEDWIDDLDALGIRTTPLFIRAGSLITVEHYSFYAETEDWHLGNIRIERASNEDVVKENVLLTYMLRLSGFNVTCGDVIGGVANNWRVQGYTICMDPEMTGEHLHTRWFRTNVQARRIGAIADEGGYLTPSQARRFTELALPSAPILQVPTEDVGIWGENGSICLGQPDVVPDLDVTELPLDQLRVVCMNALLETYASIRFRLGGDFYVVRSLADLDQVLSQHEDLAEFEDSHSADT